MEQWAWTLVAPGARGRRAVRGGRDGRVAGADAQGGRDGHGAARRRTR
ncbi:hypothetical protein LV779_26235 [Streptomyces thinghirensis]|nr:hypothetical protein [Streptomyces thinghirensis]